MEHPLDFITLDEQVQDMNFAMKEKYSTYRMFILIRETIPLGKAINSVAHGSMAAQDQWSNMPEFAKWKGYCFKKVTCKLSDKEMELIYKCMQKNEIPYVEQTESTLGGEHVLTMVFPFDTKRVEAELKPFKYLRLYK